MLLVENKEEELARRIVKFSYVEPLGWPGDPIQSLLATVGWIPARFEFETPSISDGGSYHFEFGAPEGLGLVKADLRLQDSEGNIGQVLYEDPEPLTETHLYTFDRDRNESGVALVWLEAFRAGLVRLAAATAFSIALVMTIAFWRLEAISSQEETAALLVAIPGVVAAAISRPGEHAAATQLLLGVRLLVGFAGLVAFLGGLSLVSGFAAETLIAVWRALWIVSLLTFLVTAGGYFGVAPLRSRFEGP